MYMYVFSFSFYIHIYIYRYMNILLYRRCLRMFVWSVCDPAVSEKYHSSRHGVGDVQNRPKLRHTVVVAGAPPDIYIYIHIVMYT